MYLLEPLSAKPIASLCESADQQQPASSASPQYTPRLNLEESQITLSNMVSSCVILLLIIFEQVGYRFGVLDNTVFSEKN